MKVGIFFGGRSAEREVSFTSGRMVYRYLDRQLFTPLPIFVDSLGNFILLKSSALRKTAIRDFYPANSSDEVNDFSVYIESLADLSELELQKYIAQIGERLLPSDFSKFIDFAFIAMHGPYGEDGALQGLLEWYQIPFSGSGVMASAIGIDKIVQNKLIRFVNEQPKKYTSLTRIDWQTKNQIEIFEKLKQEVGLPMVLKAPHQGSSLGVSIVRQPDFETFRKNLQGCFSIQEITQEDWTKLEKTDKIIFLNDLVDITKGIGMPVYWGENLTEKIYHPKNLYSKLDTHFETSHIPVVLASVNGENEILIEEFVAGREFTCSVIQDDNGESIALIPAEVVKDNEVDFDYAAKYQNDAVDEKIVMNAPATIIRKIQGEIKNIFDALSFNVYARIDGFLTESDTVLIHDPNTVPGMTPASFIFRQMAEIGLNSTQTLTFVLRNSIRERIRTGKDGVSLQKILNKLDTKIENQDSQPKTVVALVFGGFTENRESSYQESVKTLYTHLSASAEFEALPIFVHGTPDNLQFEILPVNLMYQDTLVEVQEKLRAEKHPFVQNTITKTQDITARYAGEFLQKSTNVSFEEILTQSEAVWFSEMALSDVIRQKFKILNIKLFNKVVFKDEI